MMRSQNMGTQSSYLNFIERLAIGVSCEVAI